MKAAEIITKYIAFFEAQGHIRIASSPLVPRNDPTTLFTSSGMQPLVPYLLGETHPAGTRLLNVQNVFRTVDIDEVGDSRHATFYKMIGNWSLGDYFKREQLPWVFEFLTSELYLDPHKLYVTVFEGDPTVSIGRDEESITLWKNLFESKGVGAKLGTRILLYGVKKNWWSRSGTPDIMPAGELGGPDSEVFYDFGADLEFHEKSLWKDKICHVNCDCGRYWEIGNNVFMQYLKQTDGSLELLPKPNVDFGGGLERLIGATENQSDMFQTSLFAPTIKLIASLTKKEYVRHRPTMQIIADHFGGSIFMAASGVTPSNKEQGYIMRRLIRRAYDNFSQLGGRELEPLIEMIVEQYKETDPELVEKFEEIKYTLLEEVKKYDVALGKARAYLIKKYDSDTMKTTSRDPRVTISSPLSNSPRLSRLLPRYDKLVEDEFKDIKKISADDAFLLYTTHGLSPTQIKSLGYTFDDQAFAEKMEAHQALSRSGAEQKFKGGLADHQERTVMGHTATHLLQQALRDVLGNHVYQTGSNITTERLRFDFSHEQKLTEEEIEKAEEIVNEKIEENLSVHFEMLPLQTAKQIGAIGLFDDKYEDKVKVYFIGGSGKDGDHMAYSKEFCGGPHVDFTGALKSFKIIKQENIGNKQRRVYAVVG